MTAREKRLRRRARVRRLRDEGLSVREIAAKLGVGLATVHRDLTADPNAPAPPPPSVPPPPKGNRRAVKHGAYSEQLMAPLREAAARYARERWPHLHDDDVARYSRQAARVELLGDHELEHGIVKDADRGEVFATSTQLARFEAQLERLVARFEASAAAAGGGGSDRPMMTFDARAEELAEPLRGMRGSDVMADPEASARAREFLRHVAGTLPTDPDLEPHGAAHPRRAPRAARRNGSGELPAPDVMRELPPGAPPASLDDLLGGTP